MKRSLKKLLDSTLNLRISPKRSWTERATSGAWPSCWTIQMAPYPVLKPLEKSKPWPGKYIFLTNRPISNLPFLSIFLEKAVLQQLTAFLKTNHVYKMLQSQGAGLLIVPRISEQTAGGRAFSYRAPFLWNDLPIHVKDADSVSTLRVLTEDSSLQ
jgi:hypothetical protein